MSVSCVADYTVQDECSGVRTQREKAFVVPRTSAGADTKANTLGAGGALQRGHGAPLEPLAQLGDALGSEFVFLILVQPQAEVIVAQAVKVGARMVRESSW